MKRDSVIIYREWKDALSDLSLEERCVAWEAIMDYAFDGKTPENKFVKVVTAMMRQRIDKDQSHYNQTCTKRAEAGKLGGLKSGINRRFKKQIESSIANASFASSNESNGSIAKQNDANEADYDCDNDKYTLLRKDVIYSREEVFGDKGLRVWTESICRRAKINESDLDLLVKEFVEESVCRDWKIGKDIPGTRSLFLTWIQNKQKQQTNENNKEDRFQRRRGTDADAWSEEDFKDAFSS